jgi:GNAT superfamily N-acetyltransferase
MSTMTQDEITEINEAVGQRWRSIDPLLPEPADLPKHCGKALVATGKDGRLAGLAFCRHQHVPADSLAQTWDAATKFTLTMRLRDADTQAADDLLTQWHHHLKHQPEASEDDTSATVIWPSRDVTGVLALQCHGLQPITVIAVRRRKERPTLNHDDHSDDLVIRHAEPTDLDAITELELDVIYYDAHFGAAFPRPATPALTRENTRKALEQRPDWTWLATRHNQPIGLAVVEPPHEATWIAGMTQEGQTAYLPSMFLSPDARGAGTGAKLITHVHEQLDARGIDLTLLHYAQLNPLSGPFWHRMGYRPLWSTWTARPASTLR